MRTKALVIATALLAPLMVVGWAGNAQAQETTEPTPELLGESTETTAVIDEVTEVDAEIVDEGGGEAEHSEEISHIGECVEEAVAEGSDPEKCVEAPSPILPEVNELIWGGLSFLIVFILLAKFAYPAMNQAMTDRTERIRTDLDRADQAKVESEQVLQQYNAQLADAKAEANRIIEEARATADAVRVDLQKRAEAEIAEMKARAAADVEASKVQALADLQSEVATLAIGAAELVIQKNLDQATQIQLIENYINQVGAGG